MVIVEGTKPASTGGHTGACSSHPETLSIVIELWDSIAGSHLPMSPTLQIVNKANCTKYSLVGPANFSVGSVKWNL